MRIEGAVEIGVERFGSTGIVIAAFNFKESAVKVTSADGRILKKLIASAIGASISDTSFAFLFFICHAVERFGSKGIVIAAFKESAVKVTSADGRILKKLIASAIGASISDTSFAFLFFICHNIFYEARKEEEHETRISHAHHFHIVLEACYC